MTQKIKVAFHIKNDTYPEVDLRFPELGNPGVGGTQFTTLAVAYYLQKYFSERIEPIILANHVHLLPKKLEALKICSLLDAARIASEQRVDIFVFKSQEANHEIYSLVNQLKLKSVARSNNTPDQIALDVISNCEFIRCHVCVGQEQLDFLRDHKVISKSTRIFHPFNPNAFIPNKVNPKTKNSVVFLGSLIPAKGFHRLARIWPQIIHKYPQAKLTVIGSANLYDRKSKLGLWGIADEVYEENSIRPYLSSSDGSILDSVSFKGLLGVEKIPILQEATVGIVNPTASTETFCSSALEVQACGTPVVSAADWGLLDTVAHKKTGLLIKNDKDFLKSIIFLLENPKIASSIGEKAIHHVKNNFSPEASATDWMSLFESLYRDEKVFLPAMKKNILYRGKFLRESIRLGRNYVPGMNNFPTLSALKNMHKRIYN
jgi:glycosyltransferase involved in cell wall biosynthesis